LVLTERVTKRGSVHHRPGDAPRAVFFGTPWRGVDGPPASGRSRRIDWPGPREPSPAILRLTTSESRYGGDAPRSRTTNHGRSASALEHDVRRPTDCIGRLEPPPEQKGLESTRGPCHQRGMITHRDVRAPRAFASAAFDSPPDQHSIRAFHTYAVADPPRPDVGRSETLPHREGRWRSAHDSRFGVHVPWLGGSTSCMMPYPPLEFDSRRIQDPQSGSTLSSPAWHAVCPCNARSLLARGQETWT